MENKLLCLHWCAGTLLPLPLDQHLSFVSVMAVLMSLWFGLDFSDGLGTSKYLFIYLTDTWMSPLGGGNVNLNPVPIFKFTYYFATEFMTSLYIVANPLLDKGYFFQICFIYSDLKCFLILPTLKSSYFSQTTFFNMSPPVLFLNSPCLVSACWLCRKLEVQWIHGCSSGSHPENSASEPCFLSYGSCLLSTPLPLYTLSLEGVIQMSHLG